MEKTLPLYRIPQHDKIVSVIADSQTAPTSFKDGDKYIDHVANRMYVANGDSDSGGVWVNALLPVTSIYYYYVLYSEPVDIWRYVNQRFVQYDAQFPSNGAGAVIYDFTYSSQRMGVSPKITGTLMYERCLDDEWDDRVCCFFNRNFHFIDNVQPSSKSNTDARYKHDITLVSERILLENVYFLNLVSIPYNPLDVVNSWTEFNFFGDIETFIQRINSSLNYSSLYENSIGFKVVLDEDQYTTDFIDSIEEKEKLVEISSTYIKDALDMIYSMWGVPYYFDGYTIHVGFSNRPLAESEGVSFPNFEYGMGNHLLNITKNISSDGIVNRITGVGSNENIPYFYPNLNPNALDLVYRRGSTEIEDAAKIVNPYKTSKLTASTTPVTTPDGSCFIYDEYNKTYNISQSELINPIYESNIETGVLEPKVNMDVFCSARRMFYNGNVKIVKDVFFLCKEGTTDAVISDYIDDISDVGGFRTPTLSLFTSIDVTIAMLNKGVDFFRNLPSAYSHGNQPAMTIGSYSFHDTYITGYPAMNGMAYVSDDDEYIVIPEEWVGHTTSGHWEQETDIDSYNERFPINIQNIPSTHRVVFCRITYNVRTMNLWNEHIGAIYGTLIKIHTNSKVSLSYPATGWTKDGYTTSLYSYGIKLNQSTTPTIGDIIYFTSEGKKNTISQLMPYRFRQNGEIWYDALNNTYPKGSLYREFENEYVYSHAKEHIENFDDIRPTITGMFNSDTPRKRIDKIVDVAFDAEDSNAKDESGNYAHPYIYVKLARTNSSDGFGFNLFDCGVDSGEMTISMKDGLCGGCNFKVMVKKGSDGYMVNPIGLFEEDTTIGGVTYLAGTPKRDENGNVRIDQYDESQQDTENNEVWIALLKDNETFGEIRPNSELDRPAAEDSFVILNILLPYAYIVNAEQRLETALLDYMESHNKEAFSFSIEFSRIYYENNKSVMDRWMSDASRVNIKYNNRIYDYFAKSYTYKMSSSQHLPSVSITFEDNARLTMRRIDRVMARIGQEKPKETVGGALDVEVYNGVRSHQIDGNMVVSGDIIINGNNSISKIMESVNNRFEQMRSSDTPLSKWTGISKRAELSNLFKDGTFRYGYNGLDDFTFVEIKRDDTSYVNSELGEGYDLHFSVGTITDTVNSIGFGQKIRLNEDTKYSIIFDAKYASDSEENVLDAYVRAFLSTGDPEQDEEITMPIRFVEGWEKYAVSFYNTYDSDLSIFFDFYINEYNSFFNVCRLMVVEGDFESYVDDTYTEPTGLAPEKFIPHVDDVSIAVDNNGSDKHFTYEWRTNETIVRISHNLHKFPSVVVIDTAGNELIGDIEYESENEIILKFSTQVKGIAYLN